MKKIGKGLKEALLGILVWFVLAFLVNYFAKDGLLSPPFVLGFSVISIIVNIMTLNSMRSFGFFYTIGWLAGSLLLKNLLGPLDFIINVIAPVVFLFLRMMLLFRKRARAFF